MNRKIFAVLIVILIMISITGCGEKAELTPLTADKGLFEESLLGITEDEFIAEIGTLEFSEDVADDGTATKTYFTETEEDDNFAYVRAYGFIDDKLCMQRYSVALKVLEGDYTKEEVYDNFEASIENIVNDIEVNYAEGEFVGTYSDIRPGLTGSWPVGESGYIQIIAVISDDLQDNFGRISLYYVCE